ncbi:tol-pal system-associated acyl-CoA thioesterase [Sphingomonas sp.]|uniref:tol-pal system-associated acyl-CoA thioesterase n=1 Tax=Sphingomonas sp. TaxID=28214 RepID=UPI002C746B54|nr:tol-pal system-associated acyl-CoA thioesterase [Sphingomonas sp.]HWK36851.1 tol-pal system-associated acyl-CoA thioesterase [Sphingomonas sp.]
MAAVTTDLPLEGRFEGTDHRFPVRVYFEDTDLSGVVYHANYLRYMERARSAMLRAAGIDQRAAHEAGEGAYAVRDLHIHYTAPARLDDTLTVVTRMEQIRSPSVHIHQRVMRGDVMLAEARVEAVFVSQGGRARRQPADWLARFESIMNGDLVVNPVDRGND